MAVFRGHVEMEEMEGEYINCSDDPTKDVQTRTPEETPKSGLRLFRLVLVSFGLLCVLQATLNISLRLVLFEDLTRERDQLETSDNNLTRERDQLQTTSYNDLTRERDQLQTSYNDLTRERDQLETSLTRERDQLQTSNQDLTRERDQLQASYNTLMKERDDLQKRLCENFDGWIKFGCSWYYVSTERKTWEESRQDCIRRGAHLVIINNREEQVFLSSFNKEVWIGLTDRDVEGTWTWVDGTPLTTAYWYKGEPNGGASGNCAEIYYNGVISWFDSSCDTSHKWICERGI